MRSSRLFSPVLFLFAVVVCANAPAQVTYEIVAKGGTNGPGARPSGGVVLAPDGNYYGTTTEGGAFSGGTVFKLTPDGVLTHLAPFSYEEGNPEHGVIVGSDGNLYGTTRGAFPGPPSSRGTVFRVSLAGELTILATFVNANPPVAPQRLLQASDGNVYGTTSFGGAQNQGSVFRVEPNGSVTTLVSFTGPNGSEPRGGLIEGSDGNLYGTTSGGGGTNRSGTVFRLTKAGALTTLASFELFTTTGYSPEAELIQTADGSFYGVTRSGGGDDGTATSGSGTVFRMTPAGVLSRVARLPSTNSGTKSALVVGTDGNFYGTTVGHFYRVTPGGELTVLISFNTQFEGRLAAGPLLKSGNGEFLGTASAGGTVNRNQFGIVHRLTEQGTATTVAAFPAPLGRHFNSELGETRNGQLYGTILDDRSSTSFFGSSDLGGFRFNLSGGAVPFRLPTDSSLDPGGDSSRLIEAPDGNLYGTVSQGGRRTGNLPLNTSPTGFIYRVNANNTASTAYQFVGFGDGSPNQTGDAPSGALAVGPDSQLYGTARLGGAHGRGTLFKLDLAGNLSVLHSFAQNSDIGAIPSGDLIFTDGRLYGLTASGGANDAGSFFSASPDGQVTAIASMPAGRSVRGRLILAQDDNFYGVFYDGGPENRGSVFRLSKSGVLTTVADMTAETGGGPVGIMQAGDGNFYGVTSPFADPGSIFRVDQSGTVTTLAKFSEDAGSGPTAPPIQASDGHLYGTTGGGGPSRGGVIYRLKILPTKQLLNISTRLRVEAGENVLIGGFIVSGDQPKKVVVRGIGPSLQERGLNGVLANPILELRGSGGSLIAANDNWKTTQRSEIEGTGVVPSNDLESAIVATLVPGEYTATVSGVNSGTGVGLVEVYDLDQAANARLANISTRGFVANGEDVMIAGLITGSGSSNAKTIVRALGPSLQGAGVNNALGNPTLDIRDANGNQLAANDNWKDDPAQAAEIQASGLPPQNDFESTVAIFPPSGAITAIVRGVGETTGVALVEVYDVQ